MHINKNSSNCERYSLFITTFFSHASVMYMLSSYFFIKKDLMRIFHMTETELGIADGFRQFGSILGIFFIIFDRVCAFISNAYCSLKICELLFHQ
jgi:hypothetical protein